MYINKSAILNDLNNLMLSDGCASYVFKTRFERAMIRIKEYAMYNKSDSLLKRYEDIKNEYCILLNSYDPSNLEITKRKKAFNVNIQEISDEIYNIS